LADTCIDLDEDGDAVIVVQATVDAYGVDNGGNDNSCADVPQGEDGGRSISIDQPECANTAASEEHELLLLESALHISMARA
jgi:hypothetical protein